ncbi:ribbon-helix-helix protein, CopG family [Candidatus Parcubacteria bacterium]|nr:ribbon-helix-helix protein, CopG family [Candidatus Parcubacteria bacterium]
MATTGIKLDENTQKRLKALAAKRDRSPHWLMRAAIESYLEREEQYEREKSEDMERWEQYQLTGKVLDHETARLWLDSLAKGKHKPWQQ